jgi:hypothetical protein
LRSRFEPIEDDVSTTAPERGALEPVKDEILKRRPPFAAMRRFSLSSKSDDFGFSQGRSERAVKIALDLETIRV